MKLLDLFCGIGGAAMGYYKAGFDTIIGVDNKYQSDYPFTFILSDACKFPIIEDFDLIHASPPCQKYSKGQINIWKDHIIHPDYISLIRDKLLVLGIPFVIENVGGSPLINPVKLCMSMFDPLEVITRRHRLFEIHGFTVRKIKHETHKKGKRVVQVFGHTGKKTGNAVEWKIAMGIDWVKNVEKGLVEAVPPVYTEYIGKEFINKGE